MTDTTSKGLFPQLTDVLYALAESHAVLLRKVQSLRLEHSASARSAVPFGEESADLPIGPSVNAGPSVLIGDARSLVRQTPITGLTDDSESAIAESRMVSSELGSMTARWTELDVGDDGADHGVIAARQPVTAAESPQAQVTAFTPSPDEQAWFEADQPPFSRGEPDGRNYNFFDELDARLADLGEQNSQGVAE